MAAATRNESLAASADSAAQVYAQEAAAQLFKDSDLEPELVKTLTAAFTKSFNEKEYYDALYNGTGPLKATIGRLFTGLKSRREYEQQFGLHSASDVSYTDRITALNSIKETEKEETRATNMANLLSGENKELYQNLYDAYNGEIDFAVDQLDSGKLETAIGRLAEALDIEADELKSNIKTAQKERTELRKTRTSNIYEQALRNGVAINTKFGQQVNGLSFEDLTSFSGILDNLSGVISSDFYLIRFRKIWEQKNFKVLKIF